MDKSPPLLNECHAGGRRRHSDRWRQRIAYLCTGKESKTQSKENTGCGKTSDERHDCEWKMNAAGSRPTDGWSRMLFLTAAGLGRKFSRTSMLATGRLENIT